MDQLRPPEKIGDNTAINSNSNPVEINMGQAPTAQPTTKTFDINNLAPETKGFTVDLFDTDIDTKFAKTKTPDAKPDVDVAGVKYINAQPTPGTNGTHISPNGTILKSKEDFRSGVKAALMVLDYAVSQISMRIAGDTRPQAYTADTQQKKLLEDVVTEYLYGKQTQMPMWLTLTLAVAGSYGLIIFGACQKRHQINQNKKANKIPVKDAPQYNPQPQTQPQTNTSDMSRYHPPVKPPIVKPQLETVYMENKKDGTLEPIQSPLQQSYSEIINEPARRSSPEYPDANITAESSAKLREMVDKGIYPMYKRNAKGGINKVKYTSNGQPIMAGKPAKLIKRRS